MVGTKIFVLQMREIIRTAIFAAIGVALIILLIWLISPKEERETPTGAPYSPGTYSAQIVLHNRPVQVAVTVTESEITVIELLDMDAEQTAFYPLFQPTLEELATEIIKKQSTKVNVSQDAAVTGQILLEAINAALGQAEQVTAGTA